MHMYTSSKPRLERKARNREPILEKTKHGWNVPVRLAQLPQPSAPTRPTLRSRWDGIIHGEGPAKAAELGQRKRTDYWEARAHRTGKKKKEPRSTSDENAVALARKYSWFGICSEPYI